MMSCKQLIIISVISLIACVAVTCVSVHERILPPSSDADSELGICGMMSQIFRTARNLPSRISAICRITFWCWIGWFPFLFYSTTWIGEMYLRYDAPPEAREHPDSLSQVGRVGSVALVTFSTVTFIASIALPWLIEFPDTDGVRRSRGSGWKPSLLTAWSYSIVVFAAALVCAPFVTSMRAATAIVAMCGM
jgi:solute carrier family 45 protein 1/2/4